MHLALVSDFNDYFHSSGGNDFFDGQLGYDRANYTHAPGAINVQLADGTVTKYTDASHGLSLIAPTRCGRSSLSPALILPTSSMPSDSAASSTNAGSTVTFNTNGTLNEFEGRGGNDTIIGNGNTRISYLHATAGVTVTSHPGFGQGASGTAVGDASVGTDTFTGVNRVRGSYFDDVFVGSNNDPNTAELSKAAAAMILSTVAAGSIERSISPRIPASPFTWRPARS